MNVDALPLRVAAFGRPGGVLGAVAIRKANPDPLEYPC